MSEANTPAGKRRPTDEDLHDILDKIWDGKSLRATCLELGLDTPSVSTWIHDDEGRRQQYMRACEGRAEYLQEDALTLNRAAATGEKVDGATGKSAVDASGAKGYLEAVKWSTARMAPKTAPVQRHEHSFATMSDEEIDREIAARQAAAGGEAEA